jgi:curved DNA-binding protein CbpA
MLKLFSRHFASKCPYQVLGLTKNSTKAEVKEKYYELAKKYHPDLQNGNSFRFQEINEAYQKIMSDEVKVQKSPEEKTARTEDFNRKMQSKKPKKSNKYNPEESSHYYYLSL